MSDRHAAQIVASRRALQRSLGPAATLLTRAPCIGSGTRGFAHLRAMEGDEVDLHAEAWANPRVPDPL